MNYTITKAKKIALIFSAVYLIVHYVVMSIFFFIGYNQDSIGLIVVGKILFGVADLYILGVLVGYFEKIKQIVLSIAALLVLVLEGISQMIDIVDLCVPVIPELISGILYGVSIVSLFVFVVLVAIITFINRHKLVEYSGVNIIRKFAFSYVIVFILNGIISIPPMCINSSFYDTYIISFSYTPFLIPYIFIIKFALNAEVTKR